MRLSKRVIYNDKRFVMDRLGAPIEFDHEHGGWFYTDNTWTPPAMLASESELLAFFLAWMWLTVTKGPSMRHHCAQP